MSVTHSCWACCNPINAWRHHPVQRNNLLVLSAGRLGHDGGWHSWTVAACLRAAGVLGEHVRPLLAHERTVGGPRLVLALNLHGVTDKCSLPPTHFPTCSSRVRQHRHMPCTHSCHAESLFPCLPSVERGTSKVLGGEWRALCIVLSHVELFLELIVDE